MRNLIEFIFSMQQFLEKYHKMFLLHSAASRTDSPVPNVRGIDLPLSHTNYFPFQELDCRGMEPPPCNRIDSQNLTEELFTATVRSGFSLFRLNLINQRFWNPYNSLVVWLFFQINCTIH